MICGKGQKKVRAEEQPYMAETFQFTCAGAHLWIRAFGMNAEPPRKSSYERGRSHPKPYMGSHPDAGTSLYMARHS